METMGTIGLGIKKIIFLLLFLTQAQGITQGIAQNNQNEPKSVFLPLAFKAQERGGICVSASALNIVEYLGCDFKLSQEEFFKLFDAGRSGASPQELERGLASIGYRIKNLYHKKAAKSHYNSKQRKEMEQKAIEQIKHYLDSGIPLSASKTGHAMTLIGYNDQGGERGERGKEGVFYIWDQGKESKESKESNKSKESNIHIDQANDPLKDYAHLDGLYEISIGTFWNKIYRVDVIEKDTQELSHEEKSKLLPLSANPSRHIIATNIDEDQRDQERFTKKAAPILLESLLRSHKKIVIPKGNEIVIINEGFKAIVYPNDQGGEEIEAVLEIKDVCELILKNSNTYYSY